jgi:hypothetical protein
VKHILEAIGRAKWTLEQLGSEKNAVNMLNGILPDFVDAHQQQMRDAGVVIWRSIRSMGEPDWVFDKYLHLRKRQ